MVFPDCLGPVTATTGYEEAKSLIDFFASLLYRENNFTISVPIQHTYVKSVLFLTVK